jgi:signal transduction histidine kinase
VVGGGVASVVGLALFMGPELFTGRPLIPWSAVGLVALPLPLGVAVGILRHGLFDIEVVVNRALVYGGLTLGVLLIYVGTVLAIGSVLGSESSFAASLLATGLAAVAALPIRDVLQRVVNRVMYGDRDEPWRALSRLGQRLELAIDPGAVFPAIVETVADALRLPYVALELGPPDDARLVTSRGQPVADVTSVPLVYGAEPVGRILLASRPGEDRFSPSEFRLLQDLARQAGVAVHAVGLREDLLRSRERLVTAREEERRRLRRDLHDGLGPSLAAIGLRAEAAAGALRSDPEKAERILVEQAGEVRRALADIRRLVEGLRPPALDELGLVGAIRQQAERFEESAVPERPGPRVTVEAPERLPDLPAAIEVAAYRIAVEALTNAVRHSGAQQCRVRIAEGDGLLVEVLDDGLGLSPDAPPGVGLESMRQRAAEVGGRCIIEPRPAGGTQVRAWLPLPAA